VLGRHLIRAACHHFERGKLDRRPRSMTSLAVCDRKSYDESQDERGETDSEQCLAHLNLPSF
jgi:hypothetical protein